MTIKHSNKKKRLELFDIINYSLITIISISVFYPFYFVIVNSFNETIMFGPDMLWPKNLSIYTYVVVFQDKNILGAFMMSSLRTLVGTVLTVFNCAMCAFALRKRHICFRNLYLLLFTIPMFFGGGLIPFYFLLRGLGLINSFFVYVIPGLFGLFYVIIFMSSFNEVPSSLEESAKIDGANYFYIFYKIYIPVSLPVLATIALFAGVGQWNSWFDTLYFTSSKNLLTLQAILMKIIRESSYFSIFPEIAKGLEEKAKLNPEGLKLATMVITTVPIIMIYPFLQKYFIKGIMIGSVKG